jgi:hypothetical protein
LKTAMAMEKNMRQACDMRSHDQKSPQFRSFLITLAYAIFGYAWIVGSELFVAGSLHESLRVFKISIIKGIAFVTATAILIFILEKNLRKVHLESAIRKESEESLKEAQHHAHSENNSYNARRRVYFSDGAINIQDLTNNEKPITYDLLMRKVQ